MVCILSSSVPRGVLRVLEHPPSEKVVANYNTQPLAREEATHTTTEIYNLNDSYKYSLCARYVAI